MHVPVGIEGDGDGGMGMVGRNGRVGTFGGRGQEAIGSIDK